MSNKIITSAVFLISAFAFQQSWAGGTFEGCSDPAFAAAHKNMCTDGLGLPKQPAPWGNNGEIKKQTAETVAHNKAALKCKQMTDPVKKKKCLDAIED